MPESKRGKFTRARAKKWFRRAFPNRRINHFSPDTNVFYIDRCVGDGDWPFKVGFGRFLFERHPSDTYMKVLERRGIVRTILIPPR